MSNLYVKNKGSEFFSEIRGVKFIWEKIRYLKILGFSEENTPDEYSPLKMTAPLVLVNNIMGRAIWN